MPKTERFLAVVTMLTIGLVEGLQHGSEVRSEQTTGQSGYMDFLGKKMLTA